MASGPAYGNGFLMAIKIRSTLSFVGEVNPSAPCRMILSHVKNPFEVCTKDKFVNNQLNFDEFSYCTQHYITLSASAVRFYSNAVYLLVLQFTSLI
jgi:hypothetical protein